MLLESVMSNTCGVTRIFLLKFFMIYADSLVYKEFVKKRVWSIDHIGLNVAPPLHLRDPRRPHHPQLGEG